MQVDEEKDEVNANSVGYNAIKIGILEEFIFCFIE
jgi:hypothetical protein